jgi:hypothetical protein
MKLMHDLIQIPIILPFMRMRAFMFSGFPDFSIQNSMKDTMKIKDHLYINFPAKLKDSIFQMKIVRGSRIFSTFIVTSRGRKNKLSKTGRSEYNFDSVSKQEISNE